MTWRTTCVLALVLAGCGDEEGGGKPPPIGPGSANGTLTLGVATATDTDGTGTDTDTDTDPTGTPDASTTEGSDDFVVIAGGFVDGGAAVDLPIECQVRFYAPGDIEPSTGAELTGAWLFQRSGFVIDAYVQAFEIHSTDVPMIERGQEGYVAVRCDGDGDGLYDDGLVGYFPGLPMQRVTVPAANVFIPIASSM